jgi:hypothetical protein
VYLALLLSLLMVSSFLVGFYLLSPYFPMEKPTPIKNQSMTENVPDTRKDWGYADDYCMKKIRFKDGTIIKIPRCEFVLLYPNP